MAIAKDLQASQQIISLFEKSKEQSEEALDRLPLVYAVMTSRGIILKGNVNLAGLMDSDQEDLLGRDFLDGFAVENRLTFEKQMQKPLDRTNCEFHLPMVVRGVPRTFVWTLTFENSSRDLITVIGQDVTDFEEAVANNERIRLELETARLVQETLFPPEYSEIEASKLIAFSQSATELGGDWWHYTRSENQLLIWIGDVTGHGVPAALIMSAVNSATLLIAKFGLSPSESLRILDKTVRDTAKGHKLMTCFSISIDLLSGDCCFSSAAHEAPIILRAERTEYSYREFEYLQTKPSYPLGSAKLDVDYKEFATKLKAGDRLCLFTDGVYDASPKGTNSSFYRQFAKFGSEERSAIGVIDKMKAHLAEFKKAAELPDDVTMIIFEYQPGES